jgi:branched-chain amino acid transport system permease protein
VSARTADAARRTGRLGGAVLVVAALGVMLVPLVVTDVFLLKVFTFVGINVIIVAGLSLLFGYAGQVSMGHAAFFGIGAFTSAFLTTKLHWPWLAAVVAAVAISALGGLALAMPSLRLKGHYLAMATLGFGEIMNILFVEAEPITGGTNGTYGIPPASIGPLTFSSPAAMYWLVAGIALTVLLLARNVVRLRPGRAMRALHGSESGAQACGVDPVRLKVQVFVVSAALAGVAGSLYAHLVGFISPSLFTLETSIVLVAMTVLGGTGSLAGPVLATAGLTLLPYVDALIPGLSRGVAEALQDWRDDIYGLTIILVMLYMPGGLAGASRRLSSRVRRGRAAAQAGQGGETP